MYFNEYNNIKYMKEGVFMKKHIITAFLILFAFVFIAPAVISAKEKVIIEKDGFYIVDGVLKRYTGDISNMDEIVLPEEVKKIGKKAFNAKYCYPAGFDFSKLDTYTKIRIPESVSVDPYAFNYSKNMEIFFPEGMKVFDVNFSEGQKCRVHIPDTVTKIEWFAFSHNSDATVFLGKNIEVIESCAFAGATIVGNVLPKNLKKIGNEAFNGTIFLKSDGEKTDENIVVPILPKGLKSIGSNAFSMPYVSRNGDDINDDKRNYINIPASVKNIDKYAFGYLGSLNYKVKVDKENKYFSSDKNGWLYSKDKKILYSAPINEEKVIIPENVEIIEYMALSTRPKKLGEKLLMPSIYLPENLKKMSKVQSAIGKIYFTGDKVPEMIKCDRSDYYYRHYKLLKYDEEMIYVKKGLKKKFVNNFKITKKKAKRVIEKKF